MPVYIPFVRVSTKKQETERQLADISAYASSQNVQLAEPIRETISGAKKNQDRPAVQELLKRARRGDTVLVTEVSRLSRNTRQLLALVEELADKGVGVYVLNTGLSTLRPDGSRDSIGQFVLTVGGEIGRMERDNTADRVRSGVAQARANGVHFGRRAGEGVKSAEKLLKDHAKAVGLLLKGHSVRDVARVAERSTCTVRKLRKELLDSGQLTA